MVGETGFPASENHFFSPFFDTPVSFFPSSRKVFFYEILHSGWWKQIFRLLETVLVFSSYWKPSQKLMEANF